MNNILHTLPIHYIEVMNFVIIFTFLNILGLNFRVKV